MTTNNATTTYTKLRNGDWGVRVPGQVKAGQFVTVTKKSGEKKPETIAKVLWAGNGISLCAIERTNGTPYTVPSSSSSSTSRNWDADKFNGYGRPTGGYRRACKTGGNCSSFGDGKDCGGHDCDGY